MMKDKGSRNKKSVPDDNGLIDAVFSWSLQDILNDNFFMHKVQEIPETFQSVEQYFRSFVYPLLEETRAQLCASLETISEAPYSRVVGLEKSKPFKAGLYDVKVDEWRNRFSSSGKEPYKTLPGDVLILADAKPESASDLQRQGRTWTFVLVTKIPDEDESENDEMKQRNRYRFYDFKAKASEANQIDDQLKKSPYVIYLTNVIPSKRIWSSLHMSRNLKIIKEVLCTNSMVEENCEQCCLQSEDIEAEDFGPCSSTSLNDSQKVSVSGCLARIHCKHKCSVELIWGPPGTGKTKTVSVLLVNLLKMKCRTLVCAPTNVAIKEVASRVLKLMRESFEADSGRDTRFCPLGDVLLIGNNERLKVGAEIEEIYLDHRSKKLQEWFGQPNGWRHFFTSVIDFLEDCVSQYYSFVGNGKGKSISFIKFVRERFEQAATQLRNCLFVFINHLPKCYILENDLQNMLCLISLLRSFETLLLKDDVSSEELEELFSLPVGENFSELKADQKRLLKQRSECHFVLTTLWTSLKRLNLPSDMNRESLIKNASLIFCTTSNSYKLHSVEMEPLDVLVIDEAAQLRESESTIPLQLPDIKHVILIGDECQLPAMVASKVCHGAGFGRSLFERLSILGHSKHLLTIQYRMHPSISFFPNLQFYQKQILDGPNVASKSHEKRYLPGPMFGTYSFINVLGGREEVDDVGHSYTNMVEVFVVLGILQKLYKAWIGSNKNLSIGVVSPYAAQVVAIKNRLDKKYESSDGFAVKVKSVDGFQGSEEDIIIISTVRSNTGGSIGFLSKPQRVNVALTRARHCLWILGNERTLNRSESVWETLVHDAKDRQCFFNADEDNDLAKVILQVKGELDELDELLDPGSILFRRQRWKVVFSYNFLQSFKKLNSALTKKLVIDLLLKLGSGWRPNKRNIDSICEGSSHIVKQFKVQGLYIVCTIDIVKELQFIQVLKVWDVLPYHGVSNLLTRLTNIFVKYNEDYVNRCKEKYFEGNLEVPKTWEASSHIIRDKDLANENGSDLNGADATSCLEKTKVSESLLLMKFYALSSGTVSYLLSDRDGRELDLPFQVTDEQLELIRFPKSTFIHGRSGTGKTTVLTMKLFEKEKLHQMSMEGYYGINTITDQSVNHENEVEEVIEEKPVLRQLFVTVSPKLCSAVKQQITDLKSSAICGKFPAESSSFDDVDFDFDDAAEFKDIPNSFVDIPLKTFPLVITFHKFLMMLDGTLGKSYFERFLGIKKPAYGRIESSVALEAIIRTKEVTYDRFSSLYWPKFNAELTKKFDSSRVYTEIISHIKGGLSSLEVGEGRLSREDYIRLSDGRISTLSMQQRETVYDIFLNYERKKFENQEFDLADLVIDLHRRLKNGKFQVDEMDFVYVDEVQDLTMSQIALFKYICRNVDEGFVFSGDTAQTIARGIDFRFQDIRALFYKKFVLESSCNSHIGRQRKGQLSDVLCLSQNFRTHSGVLKLAQSIIELLLRFFPQSIDVLKPETSLVNGEPPVLLELESDEDVIIKIFGESGNFDRNIVGFGANQVIIVRDDTTRKDISKLVGKQALVLTVLECKGLEFQDVVLYNFFGTSTLENKWRILYEYMKEQDLLDSNSPLSFPSFDEAKHSILCSELKQLYVAITRTRQRLWIWEDKMELSKPIFDYWKKKSLVQVRQLDNSLAQAMRAASSLEEWKAQGIKLFHEQNYEMATMCFERAGDPYWEKRSKDAGLKATADRLKTIAGDPYREKRSKDAGLKVTADKLKTTTGDPFSEKRSKDAGLKATADRLKTTAVRLSSSYPEKAKIILREAAEIFEAIGNGETAAKCFSDLGEYERAGRIYMEFDLRRAAECFYLAGSFKHAAEVYSRGNFFSKCLSICSKKKFFELGLQFIRNWKQKANTDVVVSRRREEIDKIEQEFLQSCALHHHEYKNSKSMMEFVKAFHSMDLKRNFLKSLNCLNELQLLEEESGNFQDAANIAILRGDILVAAGLMLKARNFKEASTLYLIHVFSSSLYKRVLENLRKLWRDSLCKRILENLRKLWRKFRRMLLM